MVVATKRITFDGGAEGAAATPASTATGCGDPIPNSPLGSGGTGTILAAAAILGAKGLRIVGNNVSWFWVRPITVGSGFVGTRAYFKIDTSTLVISSSLAFIAMRSTTASMMSATLTSARILVVQDTGAGTNKFTGAGKSALPNGNYILDMNVKKGTSTTDGTCRATLFNADTGAVIDDTGALTNANTGTTDVSEIRYGKTGSNGTVDFFDMDDVAHVEGSNQVIDFTTTAAVNILPSVDGGPSFTVDPNLSETFTLSMIATDGDGTIASAKWDDVTSGTTQVGSAKSVTLPVVRTTAQTTRTYRPTATDNSGGTTVGGNVVVTFLPHTRWHKNSSGLVVPIRRVL